MSPTMLPVTDVSAKPTRSGFWPLRDLPVVGWMLATIVVSFAHPILPAPRWLMIHLLLLGAITHSIVVWSRFFTVTLLHALEGEHDRRDQSMRLLLLNGGVLAVVIGCRPRSGCWSSQVRSRHRSRCCGTAGRSRG